MVVFEPAMVKDELEDLLAVVVVPQLMGLVAIDIAINMDFKAYLTKAKLLIMGYNLVVVKYQDSLGFRTVMVVLHLMGLEAIHILVVHLHLVVILIPKILTFY